MGKTRGVHETTPELRNRMVGMYEAGLGLREIAAAVNCSQRTVKRWLNRFDKEGTVETRERCGRKRATTSEQDEAIIRLASQTPITAAKAVLPALGLSCSVDTVRERLHKAGIHNWSPSRKHIQRIRLSNVGDSTGIQQSVWRPTGTQLGKKKAFKETITGKDGIPVGKKKTSPRKAKNKNAYISDSAPVEVLQQSESVFSTQQNLQESQSVQQSQNTDLQTSSQSVPVSQTQFNNTVTLAQQPIYHHHGLNVAQNWPLDLVQDSHHYMQGQSNPIPHEHPPLQRQLQELHTQQEQLEQQMQVQARLQDVHHQNADRVHHCQDPQAQFSQRLSESQHHQQTHQLETREPSAIELPSNEADTMILRIDSCSNSSNSNDNSQISNVEEEPGKDTTRRESERQKQRRQKKGGKAKGTLETSVELRNRMIGMSEAGLSTLSIALAINRSERTVKRWLERWHKEGNVKTKERKGRRRITTKEQDEAIIAMATAHPLTAAKYVAPALGLRCSVDTVRERLHKAGIHSWKLGKKQGEGNAVHTVHLWQPSGNRPNILRRPGEKRKKCVGDQRLRHSTGDVSKRSPRKKKNDASQLKPVPPPANIALEQNTAQFHNPGLENYVSGGNIMQTTHNIPVQQPPSHTQRSLLPSSLNLQDPPGPQSMQTLVPVVQQRPDCRLAPPIGPPVSAQRGTVAYSPCMVGNNSHTTHIDPPDSLNYEPYMWNF